MKRAQGLLFAVLLLASTVRAHVGWVSPPPRDDEVMDGRADPCGGSSEDGVAKHAYFTSASATVTIDTVNKLGGSYSIELQYPGGSWLLLKEFTVGYTGSYATGITLPSFECDKCRMRVQYQRAAPYSAITYRSCADVQITSSVVCLMITCRDGQTCVQGDHGPMCVDLTCENAGLNCATPDVCHEGQPPYCGPVFESAASTTGATGVMVVGAAAAATALVAMQ